MFRVMQLPLLVALLATSVTLLSGHLLEASSFWQKFDKNADGLLDPDEIPASMKGIVQKSAEKAGLDVTKPLSIEALLGGAKSTAANPSASADDQKPPAEKGPDPAKPADGQPPAGPTEAAISTPAETAKPSPPTPPPAKKLRRFLTPHERLPSGLPSWFVQSDRDKDAQVMMHEFADEWSDRKAAEFESYDHNGDGVITAHEALGRPKAPPPRPTNTPRPTPIAQSGSQAEASSESLSPSVTNASAAPARGDFRSDGFRGNRNREEGSNSGRGNRNYSRPEGRRSRR